MDKKAIIINRMQEELDHAHQGIVEPVAGESYMTVQYVYQKLKDSFEKTYIPEHILDVFMVQDFPLSKYYDYFIDQDYFRTEVDWNQISREYATYRETEFVEERLHDKVEAEYKEFMSKVVDLAPYSISKLLSEISFKIQVFSIFRYQDCFGIEDMKALQKVDGLLDKAFEKYSGDDLSPTDEHYLWATAMECLGKVVEDERGTEVVEEDALEA